MQLTTLALLMVAVAAAPASTQDRVTCPAGLVCASRPETVVDALRGAGYKAKLTTDKLGDPMIESSGSGYDFSVLFYDCQRHRDCEALQFFISFEEDPIHVPTLANDWNLKNRYGQARVNEAGNFIVSWDVSTVGGLNRANFTDVVASWEATLGTLSVFWRDNPSPASGGAAAATTATR